MPRYKRIRVRGKPRHAIDVDLLAQALIMASQDFQAAQQPKGDEDGTKSTGSQRAGQEDEQGS